MSPFIAILPVLAILSTTVSTGSISGFGGCYRAEINSVTRSTCAEGFWKIVLLDVLTPLSDCIQESVEKMERRITGVSYMCWVDFHNNGILCCGF